MEMSISYMWRGKDKMDNNGLKAMKYIQRAGASHTGERTPVFFWVNILFLILSDTISHLNNEIITKFSN